MAGHVRGTYKAKDGYKIISLQSKYFASIRRDRVRVP